MCMLSALQFIRIFTNSLVGLPNPYPISLIWTHFPHLPQKEHLNTQKSGFLSFGKKVTTKTILSWSKDPIKRALLVQDDKTVKRNAVECFRSVSDGFFLHAFYTLLPLFLSFCLCFYPSAFVSIHLPLFLSIFLSIHLSSSLLSVVLLHFLTDVRLACKP